MTPATMRTAYQRQLDGLYTYCLSVLCDPVAAAAATGEVRELAESGGDRLTDPALRRAWLYSAARYACVRRLAGGRADGPVDDPARQRGELAALAWPEAAGTTAEQREALELTLRHHLDEGELAAVLGLGPGAAARLLAGARAELATTRQALLVLGVGSCPELARLGGPGAEHWRGWVLGPALRRELVRHVDDCPTCRGTAGRVAGAVGPDAVPPAGLALLRAPAWLRDPAGARPAEEPPAAVFDARGLPRHRAPGLLERHRAGGDLHERLVVARQRLVSTGVLAAVLTAPLAAFWVAHRDGTPVAGAAAVSSVRVASPPPGADDEPPAAVAPIAPAVGDGGPEAAVPAPVVGRPGGGPAVAGAVPVRGLAAALVGSASAETLLPPLQGLAVPVPAAGAVPLSSPRLQPAPLPAPAAALDVTAGSYGNRTVLTLTNTGGSPLDWHAVVGCDWLRLSRDSGSLAPGQRITVIVTVDDQHAPDADWTASIALPPSSAVVTLSGGPNRRGVPAPGPSASATDTPPAGTTPSASAKPSGSASATPSDAPSAGSSASTAPSSSESPSASPTSGPSARPSASPSVSSSPSATPAPSGPSSSPAPSTAPASGSNTPDTSPSSSSSSSR
ncbi:sigma-70 family RNA polymerase sigma factor [Kitasatospora sp. NPDC006697]|uniref:sigma-70 family RNA polymerase sigma factor n=1 Tax=Kitasatospora sp. NPDC006697 TaxID=3364020 RepID=UPI0036D153AB